MDAVLFERFQPEEYHRRFVADGLRHDGRALAERRRALLQRRALAAPLGSASVRLGASVAVAGVRAQISERTPEQPAAGRIVISVELPALCGSQFRERSRAGMQGLSSHITSALNEIFNSPHVFDPTSLDIRQGEVAWVLIVDVVCLNYDGNAFDLCLLAALAALEDTSLPGLMEEVGLGRAAVSEAQDNQPRQRLVLAPPGQELDLVAEARRLKLKSRPLPVTFAQLPGQTWVVDPSASEESLGASVSLCLLGGRWLVYHLGGCASAECFLAELMPLARSCVPALTALLDKGCDDGQGK